MPLKMRVPRIQFDIRPEEGRSPSETAGSRVHEDKPHTVPSLLALEMASNDKDNKISLRHSGDS